MRSARRQSRAGAQPRAPLTRLKAPRKKPGHTARMAAHPHSFRALVLPREHGSWSLALEPVALGLLVAPSQPGAALALAALAGFFARRPLKLAWTLPAPDPRRAAAAAWTMLFAGLALSALWLAAGNPADFGAIKQQMPSGAAALSLGGEGGMGANKQQSAFAALWPLLLAAPFGAAFLWFDLRGEMREAEAEVCGSAAFALVPAAFATLAGWAAAPALALAALMLARSVPTVLVVRTYLRLHKGQPPALGLAWLTAALAGAGTLGLVWLDLVPLAAAFLACLLFARSAWLIGPFRPAWSAKKVGMMEAAVGVILLALLAFAYRGF